MLLIDEEANVAIFLQIKTINTRSVGKVSVLQIVPYSA